MMESVSLRTLVPSPADGAPPSGPLTAAEAPDVSPSVPPALVAEGAHMDADEITPAADPAPVTRAMPFRLILVPAPVAALSSPVLSAAVAASHSP